MLTPTRRHTDRRIPAQRTPYTPTRGRTPDRRNGWLEAAPLIAGAIVAVMVAVLVGVLVHTAMGAARDQLSHLSVPTATPGTVTQ